MNHLYNIALLQIKGIGPIRAKALIETFGDAETIFNEKTTILEKIPFIGESLAIGIKDKNILTRSEKEIEFTTKYGIEILFYKEPEYPNRLLEYPDSPLILYKKGNTNLNINKTIAFVGTRLASPYGKTFCQKFITDLQNNLCDISIISGLATGIDAAAHKAALDNTLPTVGILGHGLDRIYPVSNRSLAEQMIHNGALITEFLSGTMPEKENFPRRNRIIAGISDATIVVESRKKGGSLITATIAESYNKPVFAVPGRITDINSCGCNKLIKTQRAIMLEDITDFLEEMNWGDKKSNHGNISKTSAHNISEEEKSILNIFETHEKLNIDELTRLSDMTIAKMAGILLELEFKDIISCLPGKIYTKN